MIFILDILILYVFVVFILPRFLVPNYGLVKSKLPSTLPSEWQDIVDELNKTSNTQEAYLKNAYRYITKRYTGGRYQTFIYLLYAFDNPFRHKKGFLHCHMQNYLLRTLLVKSGKFTDDDIEVHTVFLNFFTHQYLRVRVGDAWIDVDPHSHFVGIPFGKKAFLFV